MKRGKQIDPWFPFWIDKWIFGSTRHELIVKNEDGTIDDLRGIFMDLMAVAKKDGGFIRANETTPYPMEQLAGMFCVPLDLLLKTIKKCLEFGKLSEPAPGVYYLNSNDVYALTDRHMRRYEPKKDIMSGKKDMPSKNPDTRLDKIRVEKSISTTPAVVVSEIVSYLNEKTGKRFNPKSSDTVKHIGARLNEGRTVEDFKRVIDTKVAKWHGKTWADSRPGRDGQTVHGDDFLCPSTLFCAKNFENYLNETPVAKKMTTEEYRRQEADEFKKLRGGA